MSLEISKEISDNDKKMIKMFSGQSCGGVTHNTCKQLDKEIVSFLNGQNMISVDVLDQYISFLTSKKNIEKNKYGGLIYATKKNCINNILNIEKSLSILFTLFVPSVASIHQIILADADDVIQLLLKSQYNPNSSILSYAIKNKKPNCALILSKYNITDLSSEQLDDAIYHNMHDVFQNIINNKIQPASNTLSSAIKIKNFAIVKTLVTSGVMPSEIHLEEACLINSKEIIKFFLHLKIVPTKESFNNILKNHIKEYVDYGYSHYNVYGIKHDSALILATELINMIISYGYILTYEDVLHAMKAYVKINNIELYDIKFDEKYMEICAETSFYPYIVPGIKENIKCLEKECCKSGNLQQIRRIISVVLFQMKHVL